MSLDGLELQASCTLAVTGTPQPSFDTCASPETAAVSWYNLRCLPACLPAMDVAWQHGFCSWQGTTHTTQNNPHRQPSTRVGHLKDFQHKALYCLGPSMQASNPHVHAAPHAIQCNHCQLCQHSRWLRHPQSCQQLFIGSTTINTCRLYNTPTNHRDVV